MVKDLRVWGGCAALYLASAYLVGIALFLLVLDYPGIVDPAQKVALLVSMRTVFLVTNLVMYVVFGVFLIVLSLALHERLHTAPAGLVRTATAIGIVWAGAVIASGMIANAGVVTVVALHGKDPAQAALAWSAIESVADGLGGARGEILGGLFTLLASLAALQAGTLPGALNFLGVAVGVVGVLSTVPGLGDLTGIFGVGQIPWFAWLGIVLLRTPRDTDG